MPAIFTQHPFMSQPALDACDEQAMVKAMLAFELALAEVQEASGAVPAGVSQQIRDQLEKATFSVDALAEGIASGGNVAIPFVKQGRSLLPNELKRYWHQGATSQDVVDSALMLLLTPRLAALNDLLLRCRAAALALMSAHGGYRDGGAYADAAGAADHLRSKGGPLGDWPRAESTPLDGRGAARTVRRRSGRALGLGAFGGSTGWTRWPSG